MRIIQIYFKNCLKKMFFKDNKVAFGINGFALSVWPFSNNNIQW
jgi:hypothetical protein